MNTRGGDLESGAESPPPAPALPMVSVLVAAWNEASQLDACLASLASLDWPDLEIFVCAGGSDDTFSVARRHVGARMHVSEQLPGQGKQAALRGLFAQSSGAVIYLTDGDTVVTDACFHAVLKPILDSEAEVVTGTYRPFAAALADPLVFYQWSIDRSVERRRSSDAEGITGANVAVTRRALLAAGGFDADVRTGTDYVLARSLRAAGCTIRFVDAAVETEYASDPALYLRRRSRWLRNTLVHGRRTGDAQEVRTSVVTAGLGFALLAGPLTFPLTGKVGAAAWGTLVGIMLRRRLIYARELAMEIRRPAPPGFTRRLPYFVVLDQAASVMSVVDAISKRRRTRW